MEIEKSELNIYDVETLHKQFIEEIKKDSIIIDMKNVNKVDATIIQLLISTQKTSNILSKEFKIINLNDELLEIFKSYYCSNLVSKEQL